MLVRIKTTGRECYASRFNMYTMGGVLLEDDTISINELDVFLTRNGTQPGVWKDLEEAFIAHDLIEDNYATRFFEPANEEDRQRGYLL